MKSQMYIECLQAVRGGAAWETRALSQQGVLLMESP